MAPFCPYLRPNHAHGSDGGAEQNRLSIPLKPPLDSARHACGKRGYSLDNAGFVNGSRLQLRR